MAEDAVKGIRVSDRGKVHARRPGPRPRTRCGVRIPRDRLADVDTSGLAPQEKCATCFPGTGRRGR